MAMRNRTLSFVRLGRIGSPLNGFSATRAPSRLFSIPSNSASRGPRLDDGAHGEVENRHVLAALVQNEQGVLARVATLFAGRGFNIDSLVVGRTEVPELSRMTIVVNCDALQLSQIQKQLQDITSVVLVAVATSAKGVVERDLMLIKVATQTKMDRVGLIQLGNVFGAKVVDIDATQIMLELSAHPADIERFVTLCEPYGIVEFARTGVAGMAKQGAAFSSLITDGSLVAERVLEKLELDASALPPG